MKVTVYIDVLLVVNLILNYILLEITAALLGENRRKIRIIRASLISSLFSLIIFLPPISVFFMFPVKLLFAVLTSCIAFPYRGKRFLMKQSFVFFVVTYLFAGIMAGIWFTFAPQNMIYYNTTVYFDINTLVLIGTSITAYGIFSLLERMLKRQGLQKRSYTLTVTVAGKSKTLQGFLDTGNGLFDLYDGTPIAVCGLQDISSILPPSLLEMIESIHQNDLDVIAENGPDMPYKIRLNPYKTVGEIGILPCFCPDRLILTENDQQFEIPRAYLGICALKIGDETGCVALNPEMIKIPASVR